MRPAKYPAVFKALSEAATQRGTDRIVPSPLSFLERHLGIKAHMARQHLKELECRGAIKVEKDSSDGISISHVRILLRELQLKPYEKEATERFTDALKKFRTRSEDNSHWVVYSGFFPQVRGDADIGQKYFYTILHRLAAEGLIEIRWNEQSEKEQIFSIKLLESFPMV